MLNILTLLDKYCHGIATPTDRNRESSLKCAFPIFQDGHRFDKCFKNDTEGEYSCPIKQEIDASNGNVNKKEWRICHETCPKHVGRCMITI